MLDSELKAKIKHLQLWAHNSLTGTIHGKYNSAFRGSGLEFDDFRQYIPGDDVKHIDWKVTARSDNTYIRMFKEERDLSILLMIDVSSSVYFGSTKNKTKIDFIVQLTALFKTLAVMNNDRCSVLLFGKDIIDYLPASPSSNNQLQVYKVLRSLLTSKSNKEQTSLSSAFHWVNSNLKIRHLVVVISDFLDDNPYTNKLKHCAYKHDLTCIRVFDPLEANPPKSSRFGYIDCETNYNYSGKLPKLVSDHRYQLSASDNTSNKKKHNAKKINQSRGNKGFLDDNIILSSSANSMQKNINNKPNIKWINLITRCGAMSIEVDTLSCPVQCIQTLIRSQSIAKKSIKFSNFK